MKSIGVVRSVDMLGRVVIPMELRKTMNFDKFQSLEIFTEGELIILKKYKAGCHCCNEIEVKATVLGLSLCEKCITKFDEARELVDKLR